MKPESIPNAVIILGEYQYKSAFVADQEIKSVGLFNRSNESM